MTTGHQKMTFTAEQFDCWVMLMRAAAAGVIYDEQLNKVSFNQLVLRAKDLFVEPAPTPAPTVEPEAQRALDDGRKLQATIDAWANHAVDYFINFDHGYNLRTPLIMRARLIQFAKECRACGDGGAFERDQEVKL